MSDSPASVGQKRDATSPLGTDFHRKLMVQHIVLRRPSGSLSPSKVAGDSVDSYIQAQIRRSFSVRGFGE